MKVKFVMIMVFIGIFAIGIHQTFANGGCAPEGTGTPGYWMNHPEAWPVDTIWIGDDDYSKEQAIAIMMMPVAGDKTLTMFPAFVAATLNTHPSLCNDFSCISNILMCAEAWLYDNPPLSIVPANSDAWQDGFNGCPSGKRIYRKLDKYNNGLWCEMSRDDYEE
jgi:hypothetical protein